MLQSVIVLTMDWITITISIFALAVSIASLARSIRGTPRPKLEAIVEPDYRIHSISDDSGDPFEARGLEVKITNHGNGMAHDVQIEVSPVCGDSWSIKVDGIETNGKRVKSFYVRDHDLLSDCKLFLSWVEYPSGKRVRMPLKY